MYTADKNKCAVHPDVVRQFKTQATALAKQCGAIRPILLRALASPEVIGWVGEQSSGKIDRRAVPKLSAGTATKPFRRRTVDEGCKTLVQILVDGSGSMQGGKAWDAMLGAYVFCDALDAVGASTMVSMYVGGARNYHTAALNQLRDSLQRNRISLSSYGENCNSAMVGYRCSTVTLLDAKSVAKPTRKCFGSFAYVGNRGPRGGTPTSEGLDAACRRLAKVDGYERKVVILWTDGGSSTPNYFGLPVDNKTAANDRKTVEIAPGHSRYVDRFTRAVVEHWEKQGIKTACIGLQSPEVKTIADDAINLNDLKELGSSSMRSLLKVLR